MAFRFIDLFAGIGGMRLAGEAAGGQCVFASEIDAAARRTYAANFGHEPAGDICRIAAEDIPDHEAMLAGIPCQPFSKSGHRRGFEDARGTLFFEVARILQAKQSTRLLLLENVKGFVQHDDGHTLSLVIHILQDLGFTVSWRVLNANAFGLPQSRERLLLVARRGAAFDFPALDPAPPVPLAAVLDRTGNFDILDPLEYTLLPRDQVAANRHSGLVFCGYRNRGLRRTGVRPGTEHLSRVHRQHNRIYCASGTHPTLNAQETSGRYLIHHEDQVRRLTLAECYRLQGFPDSFRRVGATAQQYRQIGNSVPVPMLAAITSAALGSGLRNPPLALAA